MRLHFLKPVNGWSGFLTELAIVVLGVLIALGAQQAVDGWRWRGEVSEFRAALDNELGYDFGAYRERLEQSKCITGRLNQLDEFQRASAKGERLRLTSAIRRPTSLALRTSVWQSRTADVASHLGLKARLTYATIYDAIDNYAYIRTNEREVWNEMLDFEGAGPLDRRDLLRLRGLIERGRLFDRFISANWPDIQKDGNEAGIRPWRRPGENPADPLLCKPLTWQPV